MLCIEMWRNKNNFMPAATRASNQPLKNVSRGAAEKVSWRWWYAYQIAAFREPNFAKDSHAATKWG